MADVERKASVVEERDESRLAELGYKQELNRNWSVLHNFGVSFSIIVRFPTRPPKEQDRLNRDLFRVSSQVSRHYSGTVDALRETLRLEGMLTEL